ncbi:TetR family transcriptional regulator C-terminal domain-containing protein [Micromonospora sp. DR5-3]|uniref:TetR/AcrR family transcriptional regulator n=1 Tax=unclassified Micromonospora TaxID=2617518 RepID=UPI0011D74A2E|nr:MULTISPECIES: TetR family transcriptional regulator C-terminal domain-containing protein [unclassified Micromonospora]MCW3817441.1 TetR family transcriptional regulator C-terminal domain-containing protein [Micromonospora sp. DR5-3]TYC22885.1 TetR family transcriptional regulator [Micromonospora sp. MP36]
MPKIVDHDQRRRELAAAVWQVIARDGVDGISIRSVAAASGWSSGALRHYFSTRAELLAFACEQVIEQVTERIQALRHTGDPVHAVRAILLETMPVDETRRTEDSIAFAFLALGLGDPELARVQRRHFTGMYELCLRLVQDLAERDALAQTGQTVETLARRMHAVVDGLTVHALAGHLTAEEIVAQLDAYLADLTGAELTG